MREQIESDEPGAEETATHEDGDVEPGTKASENDDAEDATSSSEDVESLEDLLDRMAEAKPEGEKVTFDALLDEVGHRSFGPLILLAGLITLAPIIGDIPGVPTIMGIFVVLTAGQLLLQRNHFWLPDWMLKRSVKRKKLCKTIEWLRKPARFVDRWLRPRLETFIRAAGIHVIAAMSVLIGALMPVMEVVPFSANGAGAALTAFGLALIFRDGLVALIAVILTLGTYGFVGYSLLFS